MKPWEVRLHPNGDVEFAELPPLIAHYLLSLPEWIEEDPQGEIRKRLYPSPDPDDEEKTREWERLMVPELFALVASARQIIEKDLVLLAQTSGMPGHATVRIPKAHLSAWIRGLQVARLSLAADNAIGQGDLDGWPADDEDPSKAEAIVCVSILGEIQALLVEFGAGVSMLRSDPDDPDDDTPDEPDEDE